MIDFCKEYLDENQEEIKKIEFKENSIEKDIHEVEEEFKEFSDRFFADGNEELNHFFKRVSNDRLSHKLIEIRQQLKNVILKENELEIFEKIKMDISDIRFQINFVSEHNLIVKNKTNGEHFWELFLESGSEFNDLNMMNNVLKNSLEVFESENALNEEITKLT